MPTYVYECGACKRSFERFRSVSDESDERCPDCGKKAQRIIAPGAGILVKHPSPAGCPDGACPGARSCSGPDARCPGSDLAT